MSTELDKLQAMERRIRQRNSQNGNEHDLVEMDHSLDAAAYRLGGVEGVEYMRRERAKRADGLRPGYLQCDCICNCASIVQIAMGPPRKGTGDVLCMTCLDRWNNHSKEHRPWPESGVVILPPEKK